MRAPRILALFAMLAIAAISAACRDNGDKRSSSPPPPAKSGRGPRRRPAVALSEKEKAILKELEEYSFKQARNGKTNEDLAHDNSLWIQLYETYRSKKGTFGFTSTEQTVEGDPVTTYYLSVDGEVRIVTDYSQDPFGGPGVTVKIPEPFLIGYDGVDLPCPCGSGKKWLECKPGMCRAPTFVIMRDNFPEDKKLKWIPPPTPGESWWTWKEGP